LLDIKNEMDGEHVMNGRLLCETCRQEYLITHGVPNLICGDVTRDDLMTGDAYSGFYAEIISDTFKEDELLYGKTAIQEYDDFQAKTLIKDNELLHGKIFLDAGCGLARMEEILSRYCGTIVAFDITPSVYKAFSTWKKLENVHIVRGDLMSMPVLENHFDIVWCDGALPYVSDVNRAMKELLRARTLNGFAYSWCYGPKIASNELLGRMFHFARLPIPVRYNVILIVSWLLMFASTIIQCKSMFYRTKKYAESVLDYSLASKINHITKDQVGNQLSAHAPNASNEIIAHPKGSIEFRVGSIKKEGDHQ
jgi:SAM-dependent methyltransferase